LDEQELSSETQAREASSHEQLVKKGTKVETTEKTEHLKMVKMIKEQENFLRKINRSQMFMTNVIINVIIKKIICFIMQSTPSIFEENQIRNYI
jgi:hypothetical protein